MDYLGCFFRVLRGLAIIGLATLVYLFVRILIWAF